MLQIDRVDLAKVNTARGHIRGLGSVLVAFSGGVDSTLLLRLALDELPGRVVAALASSPAYPAHEQEAARELARRLRAPLREVDTHELEHEEYSRNLSDRCFHCKEELFGVLQPVAAELGLQAIAYGANASDLGEHRPGHGSAQRRGVRFPLLEAGLTKSDVRAAARSLGLPNWDKPSFACLSSRIPYGQRVTEPVLRQVEAAEAVLASLGFRQVRVRHHGARASVEVDRDELGRLRQVESQVRHSLRAIGYSAVDVDPQGYESGKLSPRRTPTARR